MGWLVPGGTADGVVPLRVAPLTGRSGFRLLDHPADLVLDQGERWRRVLVTGTVDGDWLLLAKARSPAAQSDIVNVRFVFEPAYQWWAACPDTIIDVDPDATWDDVTAQPPRKCRTVYGVLRNDFPRLLELAQNTLRKFAAVRKSVRFQFKTLTAAWRPGMFVAEYNGHLIYAPVMSVVFDLTDDVGYGTRIQTLFPELR
jgi:hypothetical protein